MASMGSDITNMMKSKNIQQPAAAPAAPPAPAKPSAPSQQQVIKGIKAKRMQNGKGQPPA